MKHSLRILATFLSIALLICALPQSVLAQISDLLNASESQLTTEEPSVTLDPSVYVLGEVIDSRTETSKTFRMSDGSFIAADYGKAIHYAGSDGAWEDYDNTLSFSEASARDVDDMAGYINAGNNVSIKLANNSNSNNLLKLTMGTHKVSMHLVGANKSKALEVYPALEKPTGNDIDSATALHKFSSGAIYKDILPDVDLEYIISGSSVKENIIIKDSADSYTYTFELKLNGLTPTVDSEGNILLQDESTSETQLIIPAGYMYDANGAYSDAVSYSIAHKNGKKYTLTVTADAEWINADDRAFPVTVDPTIDKGQYQTDEVDDAYVREGNSATTTGSHQFVLAGYGISETSQRMRAFFRLNTLPELPTSAVIVNATLNLHQLGVNNDWMDYSGTANEIILAAREVMGDWSEAELLWTNQPSVNSTVLDYNTISAATAGDDFKWDITSVAQGWYNGEANHGIAIYPVTEYAGTGTYAKAGFYSIENPNVYNITSPMFTISYRDTKGLESIWTYSSHGAGVAGAGYVNGFNGNLVFVHGDMATEGSIIPVAVSHVFNSYRAGKQYFIPDSRMLSGLGWKLSVQETVLPITIEGSDKSWYVYNDADGTDLYFMQNPENAGEYFSEDGYGLKLTVHSDDTVTMQDDYGNEKDFDAEGKLSSITDVYGNFKTFVYNENNLLTEIWYYPAGVSQPTTQLIFAYNATGTLTQITNGYNSADYVTYTYSALPSTASYTPSSAGYLRKITYSLGGYTEFTYNSDGTLATVTNGDTGYTVTYGYTTMWGNKRVASVTESVGTATGQTVGFSYGHKKFTVRTSGPDDVYNTPDDILTTALFDNFGKAVCAYSTDVGGNTVYGTSYAAYTAFDQGAKTNNKLKAEAVKGITNENLLSGSGMEAGTWPMEFSGTGYSSMRYDLDAFIGTDSFRLQSVRGGTGYARRTQTVTVPEAGTYTFSAYVKVQNVATTAGGGAYLTLGGTESERLTGTTNTEVQNGWRRISVTKTLPAGSSIIELVLENASGFAYFDAAQLEKAETPSSYNLLENGSIRSSTGWTGTFTTLSTETFRGHVGVLAGNPSVQVRASQTVSVNTELNTTFVLSGWAKANSVDLVALDAETGENAKSNRKFGLLATLTYSDGSTGEQYVSFNPDVTDWQYAALAIVPNPEVDTVTVTSITVSAVYDYNANTMYFDDLCLTVEPAQTYDYDANGKLSKATDAQGNESLADYANGVDLQEATTVTGDKYEYTYRTVNGVNTHDVETVSRIEGENVTQVLTYGYDAYGNVTSTELEATGTAEKFTSSATYTEFGNYLWKVTDSLNNVTTYSYDNVTKLLAHVEDAKGNRTAYKYDGRQRTENVYLDADKDGQLDTTEPSVLYLYAQNRLSGIETATTAYTLTYDAFGNLLTIKAGNNTLATYEYAGNNGKLLKLTYGNGDFEQYFYDSLDRLIEVMYNDSSNNAISIYDLSYDANGRLYKMVDHQAGLTHLYEYDSLGRLIHAAQKNTSTGAVILEVENAYDELGRAKGSTYIIGDTAQSYGITYEDITGMVASYITPQNTFTYSYDAFDRLTTKLGSMHSIQYTYVAGTQRVATYTISQAIGSQTVYAYTYDQLGFITSIKKNGTTVSNYEYDALGRLIREDDCANSTSWVYTYDNAGNLLQKYTFYGLCGAPASHMLSLHPYNGSTVSATYTYSNSAWGDLLTGYNGTTISYDAIGNPTNWRNATNLSWHQRQLVTFGTGQMLNTTSYYYDADGIRTQKRVGTATGGHIIHDYLLDGSTILKETITNGSTVSTLYYYYDESGISGVEYNGTKYSYVKNLQGDVIAIINAMGGTVVEYKYDAWGNILSVTGSMASTLGAVNPFRYRGYYYDTESGFYYLQSRYYDPQVGRFVTADCYISTGQGILGYNMFVYCNDNPVVYVDSLGTAACTIFDIGVPLHLMDPMFSPMSGGAGFYIGGAVPESLTEVQRHLRFNLNLERRLGISTQNTLVDKQNVGYLYGEWRANRNGCGVIAIHNAKILLGMGSSIPITIADMEDLDVTFVDGWLGTYPLGIGDVLEYYNIDYEVSYFFNLDISKKGVYIISYLYTWGAHNVAVYYDGTTYTTYNVGGGTCYEHPSTYAQFVLCCYYLGDKPS